MAEKRITKKEKFEMVKELVLAADVENKDMLVEFIDREVEILSKKTGAKTKAQKENEVIVEAVYEALATMENQVTVSDFQKASDEMAEYSNQKLSAMLKKLVDAGRVVKTVEGKKSYFKVA